MSVQPRPQRIPPVRVRRFPQERLSDAELVHAVTQGDGDAMGVVWDRYSALVRSVLRASLGFDSDVEDLLQDVFIAFLRGAERMRSGDSLRAYLVGVAVRRVMGELRRRRVRRWVTFQPTDELAEIHAAPSDNDSVQVLRALYRVLERMPNRRRLAFILRHVQGCEVIEAARLLGVSESTIKREARKAKATIASRAEQSEPLLWEYMQRVEWNAHD